MTERYTIGVRSLSQRWFVIDRETDEEVGRAHRTREAALTAMSRLELGRQLQSREGYGAWKASTEPPCTECGGGKGLGHTVECPQRSPATDTASEYGRLLAERDRLLSAGVDPSDLDTPLPPPSGVNKL